MIVVTGANGFIGSAFIWQLNEAGQADILAVDSVPPRERPAPLAERQIRHFVSHDELWNFLSYQGQNVEWVVHMGACSSTTEMDREFLWKNNTFYTIRLFQWCQQQKVPFIYASSGATYGDGSLGFSEDLDPEQLQPLNPYGDSKVAFDRWVLNQPYHAPWYGLRFFNVYGPGEAHKGPMASVVYKAFHQIQDTGQLKLFRSHNPLYRNGEQLRDFVYVKDITTWMFEIMKRQPRSGIYNMGFGQARTWLALAHAVFKNLDRESQIEWIDIPENIRDQYQYHTEARIDRLMAANLPSPQWDLEKGVADYVKRLREGKNYF